MSIRPGVSGHVRRRPRERGYRRILPREAGPQPILTFVSIFSFLNKTTANPEGLRPLSHIRSFRLIIFVRLSLDFIRSARARLIARFYLSVQFTIWDDVCRVGVVFGFLDAPHAGPRRVTRETTPGIVRTVLGMKFC